MINLNSNINKFINRYTKKVEVVKLSLKQLARQLAQKMSTDMAIEISTYKYIWEEENTNMDSIPNIDFNIKQIKKNSMLIEIGKKMPKLEMSDGTEVSPVFFIEFGFGIVGQNIPKKNHNDYDWYYNINGHKNYWYFKGKDGRTMKSKGREGINFMYNTIQKYQTEWKNFFFKLVKENFNNAGI